MKFTFFDLESTDLSASWGRVLCASFANLSGDVYTFRGDKRPHHRPTDSTLRFYPGQEIIDDSALVVAIRDELESADVIVSWNGILFDIPLLNARLQVSGERPFRNKTWPEGSHLDLMYYATGSALRVGSKKLDNVAKFFKLANQKTPLDGLTWQRAAAGSRKAMDDIVEHCEADVLVLRETLPYLAPHVKKLVLPFARWWKIAQEI